MTVGSGVVHDRFRGRYRLSLVGVGDEFLWLEMVRPHPRRWTGHHPALVQRTTVTSGNPDVQSKKRLDEGPPSRPSSSALTSFGDFLPP